MDRDANDGFPRSSSQRALLYWPPGPDVIFVGWYAHQTRLGATIREACCSQAHPFKVSGCHIVGLFLFRCFLKTGPVGLIMWTGQQPGARAGGWTPSGALSNDPSVSTPLNLHSKPAMSRPGSHLSLAPQLHATPSPSWALGRYIWSEAASFRPYWGLSSAMHA